MKEQLAKLALEEAPTIINWLKALFHRDHPDEPLPTNEEVIAAYNRAFASSLAKDDDWLATHPKVNNG